MAEISAEVREDKPVASKPAADLALDDDDNVADFLEVQAALVIMLLCPALICPAAATAMDLVKEMAAAATHAMVSCKPACHAMPC